MEKRKLIRVTTSDISLESLIKGQLKFLSNEFEVVGVSNNTGMLQMIGEREGIRVIEVPMHREISLKDDVKCLWVLYRLFKRERPDIVHANTPKGSLLSMLAARCARVPHRIYTVTGLRYQGAKGLFRDILIGMERITCWAATKVIPEGQGVLHTLQSDKITKKSLSVIYRGSINGIDTEYFSREVTVKHLKQSVEFKEDIPTDVVRMRVRQSLGLADDDFGFIFIGRIVRGKGMHELASAMKKFSLENIHCKLILVGNFEEELDPLLPEDMEFFTHDQSVKFVGYQNDVRPYLFAADALVFPSYREGFPNVVLQAGAMELPSIVTDINGCNEIIEDNINGIIIPSKDVEALYMSMKYFMEHIEKIKQMGIYSRPLICKQYEQQDVWHALSEEYRRVLSK